MHKIYLVLFCCQLGLAAQAQRKVLYTLKETTDSVKFGIAAVDGKIGLQLQGALSEGIISTKNLKENINRAYNLSTIPITFNKKNFKVQITKLELSDADLILECLVSKVDRAFFQELDISLYSESAGRKTPALGTLEEQEISGRVDDLIGWQRLVWKDALETALDFGGQYVLYLDAELLGEFDCDAPKPTFDVKKQLPHYLIAGAGLAMVGIGEVYRQQKIEAKDQYELTWRNGADEASSEQFKKDYDDADKISKITSLAGWSVVGLNAAWYVYRALRFKKKGNTYEEICNENKGTLGMQVVPFASPPGKHSAGIVGVGINVRF